MPHMSEATYAYNVHYTMFTIYRYAYTYIIQYLPYINMHIQLHYTIFSYHIAIDMHIYIIATMFTIIILICIYTYIIQYLPYIDMHIYITQYLRYIDMHTHYNYSYYYLVHVMQLMIKLYSQLIICSIASQVINVQLQCSYIGK